MIHANKPENEGVGTRHAVSLRVTLLWMVLILLLGFTVLMHGLLRETLWADEGWTIAATNEANPADIITDWVVVDVHPPLFFLGLNVWRRFTDDTIFEMRYYSVLLTVVGIAVMYRLGAGLFGKNPLTPNPSPTGGEGLTSSGSSSVFKVGAWRAMPLPNTNQWHTAGLLAALFYALHDLVKVLSQEVRHYPQQMLLATLTMWLYWRFWQKPTRGRGVLFALAGAALVYTHYWGGLVLVALAVHAVVTVGFGWRVGGSETRPYSVSGSTPPAMRAHGSALLQETVRARHVSSLPGIQADTQAPMRGLVPFVLAFGLIGLLFLPWIPALVNQITLERPGGLPHALDNTPYVYAVLTYQLIGVPELLWVVLAFVGALGAFGTIEKAPHPPAPSPVPGEGEKSGFDKSPYVGAQRAAPLQGWRAYLPTPATLVPLLVAVLVPALSILLNVFYPTLSFRSLAVVIPAVIVLAAHGLSRFRPREQMVMVVFIVLFSLSTTSARPAVRPPWLALADDLAAHTTASDVILLELDTDEHAAAYYLEQTGADVDFAYTESVREFHRDDYDAYLDDALAAYSGVWVAKLGWIGTEGEYDIRPDLNRRGFVQTMPEQPYALHIDRPIVLWRLDRLPQGEAPVTVFGDELSLARAETTAHPGGVVVNLLWVPQMELTRDYTVSVILFGADRNVNLDSRPQDGEALTSTWEAGRMYFDSHWIATADLPPGTYRVGVQVYAFTDETFTQTQNLPAADCSDDAACRFVIVGEVEVRG